MEMENGSADVEEKRLNGMGPDAQPGQGEGMEVTETLQVDSEEKKTPKMEEKSLNGVSPDAEQGQGEGMEVTETVKVDSGEKEVRKMEEEKSLNGVSPDQHQDQAGRDEAEVMEVSETAKIGSEGKEAQKEVDDNDDITVVEVETKDKDKEEEDLLADEFDDSGTEKAISFEEEDDDIIYEEDLEEECVSEEEILNMTVYDGCVEDYLKTWGEDGSSFELWQNPEFRKLYNNVVSAIEKHASASMELCRRANNRRPTVEEFWNFYLSRTLPREGMRAVWWGINGHERGWPMMLVKKADVYYDGITFATPHSAPTFTAVVVHSMPGCSFNRGDRLKEIPIWQLILMEPVDKDSELERINMEDANTALLNVRKFFENIHFPSDSEDLATFVETTLYKRLTQMFYLQNPSPNDGTLSAKDRSRIINGIKYYHNLKNDLQDAMVQLSLLADRPDVENNSVADYQTLNKIFLERSRELEQYRSHLAHLFNPDLRGLLPAVGMEASSRNANERYESILVIRNANLDSLLSIQGTLALLDEHTPMGTFEIMTDLECALKKAAPLSTIYVVSGNYSVGNLGQLSHGGKLIGIKVDNKEVTITPTDDGVGEVWMLVTSENNSLLLKNLTFVIGENDATIGTMIFASSGSLKMETCTFRRTSKINKKDQKAFGKADNAVLETVNCAYSNFDDDDGDCVYID